GLLHTVPSHVTLAPEPPELEFVPPEPLLPEPPLLEPLPPAPASGSPPLLIQDSQASCLEAHAVATDCSLSSQVNFAVEKHFARASYWLLQREGVAFFASAHWLMQSGSLAQ